MQCLECPLSLPLGKYCLHVNRIHMGGLGEPHWACPACPFYSLSPAHGTLHSILTAHPPVSLKTPPDLSTVLAEADRFRSSANKSFLDTSDSELSPLQRESPLSRESDRELAVDDIEPELDPGRVSESRSKIPTVAGFPQLLDRQSEKCIADGDMERELNPALDSESPSKQDTGASANEAQDGFAETAPEKATETNASKREAKKWPDNARTCRRCSQTLIWSKKSVQRLERHVVACLKLRPFACGGCGALASQRSSVHKHQRRYESRQPQCRNAPVLVPNKARHETAIRNGFLECFAIYEPKWRGIIV